MAVTESDEVLVTNTAVGASTFSKSVNRLFLIFDFFDDGFDHQITACQILQTAGRQQTAFVASHRLRRQTAFFLQLVPLLKHRITRFGNGVGLGVIQPDLATCLCRDLGNAAPHGAGADDGYLGECEGHVEK